MEHDDFSVAVWPPDEKRSTMRGFRSTYPTNAFRQSTFQKSENSSSMSSPELPGAALVSDAPPEVASRSFPAPAAHYSPYLASPELELHPWAESRCGLGDRYPTSSGPPNPMLWPSADLAGLPIRSREMKPRR